MYFGEYELLIIKMNDFIKRVSLSQNYGENFDYLFGLRCFNKNMSMNICLNEYNRKPDDRRGPNGTYINSVSCIQIDRIGEGVVYIAGNSSIYKDSPIPYPVFDMDKLFCFVKDFFYFDDIISKKFYDTFLTEYPFHLTLAIPKHKTTHLNYDSIIENSDVERFIFNGKKEIDVLSNFLT